MKTGYPMNLFETLSNRWQTSPVTEDELTSLLGQIEVNWKRAIELLAPATLVVQNGTTGYGPLTFAFGSVVSLRAQTAVYKAHIDSLSVLPKELANNCVFSCINGSLYDQNRSRGMLAEYLRKVLNVDDGSADLARDAVSEALALVEETGNLTRLLKQGLDKLWNQYYMS